MKIIDLTHYFENEMSVFCEEEKVDIKKAYTMEKNGFRETEFNIFSHNGTHIDAPYHVIENGKKLEEYSLEKFCGKAFLIDFEESEVKEITMDMLKKFNEIFKEIEIIIIKTGQYKKWNSEGYQKEYKVLTKGAAEYLASFNLKIIGFDTISPDLYTSHDLPIHNTFLEKDILILENLDLQDLNEKYFNLTSFPMKYKDGDGSFVRAVAFI